MNTYKTRNIGLTIFLMMNSQTVINSKILDNYNVEIETELKIKSELLKQDKFTCSLNCPGLI